MTSRVELDIDARQPQLAALFANPQNRPEWMDDLERIEPISGAPGQFGSIYRLVPKRKGWEFVATVVRRALPMEVALLLIGPQRTCGGAVASWRRRRKTRLLCPLNSSRTMKAQRSLSRSDGVSVSSRSRPKRISSERWDALMRGASFPSSRVLNSPVTLSS